MPASIKKEKTPSLKKTDSSLSLNSSKKESLDSKKQTELSSLNDSIAKKVQEKKHVYGTQSKFENSDKLNKLNKPNDSNKLNKPNDLNKSNKSEKLNKPNKPKESKKHIQINTTTSNDAFSESENVLKLKLHNKISQEKTLQQRIKKNFFKHKKVMLWGGGIVLFLLVIVYVITTLHLTLNPELRIHIDAYEKYYQIQNGDTVDIDFVVTVDDICVPNCMLSLIDVNSNQILYSTNYSQKIIEQSYSFPIQDEAQGQKYFLFEVQCQNPSSRFCSTSDTTYIKTSFVLVEHELNSTQIEKRNQTERAFLDAIDVLYDFETRLVTLSSSVSTLDYSSNRVLEEIYIQEQIMQLNQSVQNYTSTLHELFLLWNEGFYDYDVPVISSNISAQLYQLEQMQQDLFLLFEQVQTNFMQLRNMYSYLLYAQQMYVSENSSSFSFATSYIDEYSDLERAFIDKSFSSYFDFEQTVSSFLFSVSVFVDIVHVFQTEQKNDISTLLGGSFDSFEESCDDVLSVMEYLEGKNESVIIQWMNETNITQSNATQFITALSGFETVCYVPPSVEFVSLPELVVVNDSKDVLKQEILKKELPSQQLRCCANGCVPCTSSSSNIPVLFIHGHAINKYNSPDDSLHAFSLIQKNLRKEGFVDGGELYITEQLDYSLVPAPMMFRTTYYYISYFDVGEYKLESRKTASIENYAIRLKELIDVLLIQTGAEKIHLVAHSMGGLVARQYMVLFGESNLESLILVGTPNNGILGNTNRFCPVFGASIECNEMAENSVLLKRLERHTPTIPIYTIAGVGCDMRGLNGDGVVTKDSVALSYATNYIISGSCSDVLQTSLHSDLMDPNLYPEVQDLILELISK